MASAVQGIENPSVVNTKTMVSVMSGDIVRVKATGTLSAPYKNEDATGTVVSNNYETPWYKTKCDELVSPLVIGLSAAGAFLLVCVALYFMKRRGCFRKAREEGAENGNVPVAAVVEVGRAGERRRSAGVEGA
jgi:hypothetical protein